MDALRSVYYDVEFKADDNPLEKADRTVDDLTESLEKMGKTGEKAGKKVEDSFDDANDEIDKLGKTAKGTTDKLGGIGDKFSGIGMGLKGLTTGITGFLSIAAIKQGAQMAYDLADGFANVEYAAAKVNTLAKQDLPTVLEDMRDIALDYGITDATLVGEAMYQALSAGRSYEDLTGGFMDGILKTSKAGFVDPLGAVDLTTTIMNTFDVNDANDIGDVLLATQNKGKTTVNEMSQYYSRHLASFNAIGIGYKDAFGLLAEATKKVSTADASTGIGAILGEFSRSGSTVNEYFKELNGDTIPEFLSKGGSIVEVIRDIRNTLDVVGMPAADMFGSLEASRTFDALTVSIDSLVESMEYVATSTGELDSAFKTMNETSKSEMDKTKAALNDAMTDLGQTLMPVVSGFMAGVADITNLILKGDTSFSHSNGGYNDMDAMYYAKGYYYRDASAREIAGAFPSAYTDLEKNVNAKARVASATELDNMLTEKYNERASIASSLSNETDTKERIDLTRALDMNDKMIEIIEKQQTLQASIINPMDFMSIEDRVSLSDQLNEINNSTSQAFTTSVTNHITVSPAERYIANEIAREIEKSTIAYIPKTSNRYDPIMMTK